MLQADEAPQIQAALVNDLGVIFEQEVPDIVRRLVAREPLPVAADDYGQVLAYIVLNAPAFSLRGGTREILRGIIARGVGLR